MKVRTWDLRPCAEFYKNRSKNRSRGLPVLHCLGGDAYWFQVILFRDSGKEIFNVYFSVNNNNFILQHVCFSPETNKLTYSPFCHTTLCIARSMAWGSVRSSVCHIRVLSGDLSIYFHLLFAHHSSFALWNITEELPTGSPLTGASNVCEYV